MTENPTMSIYEKAFAQSDKTDAVIVVQGVKLHVNKALLSYHSDYFKTLFNSDIKDKSVEEITIEDISSDVLAIVISHVHSIPLNFSPYIVEVFLQAADRFQLPFVKRRLELLVLNSVGERNKLLKLADEYHLDNLVEHAVSLFSQKMNFSFAIRSFKPDTHLFNSLSNETNIKLFHRLLEIDGKVQKPSKAADTMDFYEKTFAKSDKTDAVLVVDGKKLHVNKAVLSHHSDYFNALFNSDFKEKSMEEIPIENVDFEAFATLLSFVHLSPISPTKENAEKVLELADRFLFPSVKHHMNSDMTALNFEPIEAIRIGEKYGMNAFYEHGMTELRASHFVDLPNKDAYKEFSSETKKKMFFKYLSF